MKDKLKFLPLLALYIVVIIIADIGAFWGDEAYYAKYANNLLHGYYVQQVESDVFVSPGYPIVLIPSVLLGMPWIFVRLLNGLFLFLAVLYVYYTMRFYIPKNSALRFSYLIGIYPPFFLYLHRLITETLVILLVCGLVYHFCNLFQNKGKSWIQLLISSIYLGYLALTKAFFGYVILAGLLLFFTLYLLKRTTAFKKVLLIYCFALLLCMPYLCYTYSMTGKIFYWANYGGASFYWMTTPYPDEMGGFRASEVSDDELHRIPERHRDLFNELRELSIIKRDAELKKRAIQNIIDHPAKFFKNWVANVGRLLFNYPFYFTHQTLYTYVFIIPNMFLYVFCVIAVYLNYKRPGVVPFEVYALLSFVLISFAGLSLLSVFHRMFQPMVPIIMLWMAITITRTLKVEILQ